MIQGYDIIHFGSRGFGLGCQILNFPHWPYYSWLYEYFFMNHTPLSRSQNVLSNDIWYVAMAIFNKEILSAQGPVLKF